MKRIICLTLCLFCAGIQPAFSYWIWTPKTGKWINPKTVSKTTAAEQLDFARGFFEAKEYEEAAREFKKLLKSFPKSKESAEAQYYQGLVEEVRGNLYEAYLAYQKVIDTYPFSERIGEIIEREYAIAEAFMSGKARRKALGVDLPVENPAIEIFSKVIENSQFGPYAARAQYKLGMMYKSLSLFQEAEGAFQKVIDVYPQSEWVEPAKYQIAAVRASFSKGFAYDQGSTSEALKDFQEFLRTHPDAQLSEEAEKNIRQLKEKEAQGHFEIARFYEKQKDYAAAEIYYNGIINDYPDSIWAARAVERLSVVEKRKKR